MRTHATRALDRLPRRRASRAFHASRAVLLAVIVGLGMAGGMSQVALADPPAGTSGGWLELTPDHGRASAKVNAAYWYVDPNGGGACPSTVTFLWDAKEIAGGDPLTPPAGWDCAKTPITFSFSPPTTTTTWHRVTACSYLGAGCSSGTRYDVDYYIDPTPTLKLAPNKGLKTIAFTATYSTGESGCSWTDARFSWNGKVQGSLVPLDQATCTAVMAFKSVPLPNAPGKYKVDALACNSDGCQTLSASATFTVTPPPTPTTTPKPTPTPTPTPTAVPTPTALPTPSVEPSTSPSTEPSAIASPSEEPSPSPTGEVLGGATNAPETPSPTDAAVIPAASPSGNSYVPAIVNVIGGPDAGSIDPSVVATNILLTLLVLFIFGLTAEVFNSTMDANRLEVHGWWTRLFRGPLALFAAMNISGASLGHLSGSGRIGSYARIILVLSLLGIIYGFLSPDFGWNPQSLILIVSLIVGLGFLTIFSEGSATRLATSRYRADASIKLYGTAIIVAILAVVISRLVDFSPGLVYGFIASAVIVAPVALARRDDATLILVPAFGVLVVSLLAWLLLGPVRAAAADGAPLPALAETILAMIMIGGLEGLFITMLPLTFMDGAVVKNWSRVGWAVVFGIVTFLWWQLLLNQDAAYLGALEQTNVRVVLATLGVFMLTTGLLWSYFRFRPQPTQAGA